MFTDRYTKSLCIRRIIFFEVWFFVSFVYTCYQMVNLSFYCCYRYHSPTFSFSWVSFAGRFKSMHVYIISAHGDGGIVESEAQISCFMELNSSCIFSPFGYHRPSAKYFSFDISSHLHEASVFLQNLVTITVWFVTICNVLITSFIRKKQKIYMIMYLSK